MDLFALVREKFHEEVPLYLRNILKHSGYDNRLSLASITEKEITQIELFAKTQLKYILLKKSNVKYEEIYNLYSENIEDFIILPGHKKLLLAIGEMCAEENNKMKLKESFFNDDYNAKRRKFSNLPIPSISEDLVPVPDACESTNGNKSVDSVSSQVEYKYVYDICYQWIKKFSDTLPESEQNKVIETLHRLEIKISSGSLEDTVYFAYIKCSLCQTEIKTQKRIRREGNSTWLFSNFYKHFKFHFYEKPAASEKKTGTLKSESRQSHASYPEEENSLSFEEVSLTEYENNFKQEMLD